MLWKQSDYEEILNEIFTHQGEVRDVDSGSSNSGLSGGAIAGIFDFYGVFDTSLWEKNFIFFYFSISDFI